MWPAKTKRTTLVVLGAFAVAIVAADPSCAATLVGTTTDASGIDALVFDSTTYNVTFVNGSYNSVYSTTNRHS